MAYLLAGRNPRRRAAAQPAIDLSGRWSRAATSALKGDLTGRLGQSDSNTT